MTSSAAAWKKKKNCLEKKHLKPYKETLRKNDHKYKHIEIQACCTHLALFSLRSYAGCYMKQRAVSKKQLRVGQTLFDEHYSSNPDVRLIPSAGLLAAAHEHRRGNWRKDANFTGETSETTWNIVKHSWRFDWRVSFQSKSPNSVIIRPTGPCLINHLNMWGFSFWFQTVHFWHLTNQDWTLYIVIQFDQRASVVLRHWRVSPRDRNKLGDLVIDWDREKPRMMGSDFKSF